MPLKRIALKHALTVGLTSIVLTATPSTTRPAIAIAAEPVATSIAAPVRARRRKHDKDISDPRQIGGRIADAAEMIPPSWAKAVGHNIRLIEKEERGSQVLVVTVNDVPAGQKTPKEYANYLFNRWGVGSAKTNNGVLVLVVKNARRVEIEVGVGVEESFSNKWCTGMLKQEVVPLFKDGKYGQGINAAVLEIGDRLNGGGKRFEAGKSGAGRVSIDTVKETARYGVALLAASAGLGGDGDGGSDGGDRGSDGGDYGGGGFSSGDSGGGADW